MVPHIVSSLNTYTVLKCFTFQLNSIFIIQEYNVGGVIHHYKGVKCDRENCRKKSYVRLMLENLYLTIGILLRNHD